MIAAKIDIGVELDLNEEQLQWYKHIKAYDIDLQYNLSTADNVSFNIELVKKWIEKIKKADPNNEFKYKISYILNENYIADSKECKELEKIDEYLRKEYETELFVAGKDDQTYLFGFRRTIEANRRLDEIADKIKNATNDGEALSPFEKFMLAYEYVTDYSYKDSNDEGESRHWVPVIDGDKIVCVGYASLLKALCDRIFSSDEVFVMEQSSHVYLDRINSEAHANNLVFIKDNKYGIDGWFYCDACWDSIKKGNEDKAQAYCCIPFGDVAHRKKKNINFRFSLLSLYLKGFEEYEIDSFYTDNSFVKFGKSKKIDFADFIEDRLIMYPEKNWQWDYMKKTLGLIEYDGQSAKEFVENARITNAKKTRDYLNKKCNSSIPPSAFANSYMIIGKQKGLNGRELREYAMNRFYKSILRTHAIFDVIKCRGCFAKIDLKKLKPKK